MTNLIFENNDLESAYRQMQINESVAKLTDEQIEAIISQLPKRWCSGEYEIKNGVVNVDGDVNMSKIAVSRGSRTKITQLPFQFGTVTGSFRCDDNALTTLVGCPTSVLYFSCSGNPALKSLEGGPKSANGGYEVIDNGLTTLKGAPKSTQRFNCSNNNLTSLEGGPTKVGMKYDCSHNKLTSLEGAPKLMGGTAGNNTFDCGYNKLTSLEGGPNGVKYYRCIDNKLTSLAGIATKSKDGNGKVKVFCENNPLKNIDADLNKLSVSGGSEDLLSELPDFEKWEETQGTSIWEVYRFVDANRGYGKGATVDFIPASTERLAIKKFMEKTNSSGMMGYGITETSSDSIKTKIKELEATIKVSTNQLKKLQELVKNIPAS